MTPGSFITFTSAAFLFHDPWRVGSTKSMAMKHSVGIVLHEPVEVTRHFDGNKGTYVLTLCCGRVGWVHVSLVAPIDEPWDER